MFVGEAIVRQRREQTGTDRYGNPIYQLVNTTLAERAAFDPGGSREPVEQGRDPVITTPKLYFPASWPDLAESDRVFVRGQAFTVQGTPADWKGPFAGPPFGGLVVELQRLTG